MRSGRFGSRRSQSPALLQLTASWKCSPRIISQAGFLPQGSELASTQEAPASLPQPLGRPPPPDGDGSGIRMSLPPWLALQVGALSHCLSGSLRPPGAVFGAPRCRSPWVCLQSIFMCFCHQGGSFHSDQPGRRLNDRRLVAQPLWEGERQGDGGESPNSSALVCVYTLPYRGGVRNYSRQQFRHIAG